MGPQLADLNKDGKIDLISGSWPGELTVFWGTGKNQFGQSETLKFTDGKAIKDQSASSVAVSDWNGDGHQDLIVGYIAGPVFYYQNNGSNRFAAGVPLTAGGEAIEASDGGPCIADWDSDGVKDLILGDGEGGVRFFKASKAKPIPSLAAGQWLTPAGGPERWEPRVWGTTQMMVEPAVPGVRAKPEVADWNNDGKLDLIVGDFLLTKGPEKVLNEAQKKRLAELDKQIKELDKDVTVLLEKLTKATDKAIGYGMSQSLSKDKQEKWQNKYLELYMADKDLKTINEKISALYKEREPLVPQQDTQGFVWVYLRK